MAEVVRGSEADKAALAAQLNQLYNLDFVVVAGSAGRAAIYEALGYPEAPNWEVTTRDEVPGQVTHRDLDLVLPFGHDRTWDGKDAQGPHPIDLKLNTFFDHEGGYRLGDTGDDWTVPVDPRVFATRTRTLAGAPVRTFMAGTQFMIDQICKMRYGEGEKFEVLEAQLGRFAAWAAIHHPDEFLPPAFYRPFKVFNPLVTVLRVPGQPKGARPAVKAVREQIVARAAPGTSFLDDEPVAQEGGTTVPVSAIGSVQGVAEALADQYRRLPLQSIATAMISLDERIAALLYVAEPGSDTRVASLMVARTALEEAHTVLGREVRDSIAAYFVRIGIGMTVPEPE